MVLADIMAPVSRIVLPLAVGLGEVKLGMFQQVTGFMARREVNMVLIVVLMMATTRPR